MAVKLMYFDADGNEVVAILDKRNLDGVEYLVEYRAPGVKQPYHEWEPVEYLEEIGCDDLIEDFEGTQGS